MLSLAVTLDSSCLLHFSEDYLICPSQVRPLKTPHYGKTQQLKHPQLFIFWLSSGKCFRVRQK